MIYACKFGIIMYFATSIEMIMILLYGHYSASADKSLKPRLQSCSMECLPCSIIGCCSPISDDDNDLASKVSPIHTFKIKFLTCEDAARAAAQIMQDGTHRQYLVVNIIKSSPIFGNKNVVLVSTDDDQYFDPTKKIGEDIDRPETLWSKNAIGLDKFMTVFSIKYHSYRIAYNK